MSRVCVITLAVTFLAIQAFGAEIRGTIVGVGQNPLEGAVIICRPTGAKALTDARGEFAIDVPDAEKVRLEVIHPDYYEREFLVAKKDLGRRLVFALVPLIRQNEEVIVTALRYPEPAMKVPAVESVVSHEALAEKMPANVTEGLQDVPGVAALGSGGFSLVPTVRGLARRRVLYLIDGARIESDRRTGPNASFLSPEDIDRIEVLRSPSSVFYGSDAIGGVIHLMTKTPSFEEGFRGRVNMSYGTVNGETGVGVFIGGARKTLAFSLSFQILDAGNYRAPGGLRILQSQFRQGSLLAKLSHRTDKREIGLSFLGARGTDIGKPNSNASTKPTWYPRENQNLVQFHWREKDVGRDGELLFHAFLNPNFLETRTDTYDVYKTNESFARTQSTDFGAQISYGKKLGPAIRLEGGMDYFGRGGAQALNTYTSFDSSGAVTAVQEEISFTRGRRGDLGFFLSFDYFGIKRVDILGGARLDLLGTSALPGGTAAPEPDGVVRTRKTKPTGFVGLSYNLVKNVFAFVNLSRAYRLPSLNELYYTGISGRGFIVGQPGLLPETSLGLDGGVRWLGRRLFAGLYAFSYEIDDMIERYRLDPLTYTYGNIEKGRVRGLELEAEFFVQPGWKLFGNMYAIRGRSLQTGSPLNDIPPLRIYGGTRVWAGPFSGEVSVAFNLRKDDPGPAEVAIRAWQFVSLKTGYARGPWNIYLALANVFNATFIARADSEAMVEPGRNLRVGLAFAF
jgi:outer membrane receptor protein involved in Fe transport